MAVEAGPSRKARILAAAEAEFAEQGFQGARVERIALAASVNKQLLFHYFDSKAGLHRAVSEAVAARSAIAPPDGKTPSERLRSLIGQLVRAVSGYQTLLSPDWRSKAAAAVRTVIADGQRSGHFRDDADADAVAELVVAASFGIRQADADAERAGADQSRFAGSLAELVIDHCTWR